MNDDLDILEYSGWLKVRDYGESTDTLFLVDNLKDDGEEPFAEILQEQITNRMVSISYYIAATKCTLDEAQMQFLAALYGQATAEFSPHYSEITGYLWTDQNISVGGHDLLEEFMQNVGGFLILRCVIEPEHGKPNHRCVSGCPKYHAQKKPTEQLYGYFVG